MYKGVYAPDDLLRAGRRRRDARDLRLRRRQLPPRERAEREARAAFQQVTAGEQWAAFGYIAAEAELARMR